MFKVCDKWELSVLEKYGFVFEKSKLAYTFNKEFTSHIFIYDDKEVYFNISNYNEKQLTSKTFYKLIKDGIIEEVE